MPAVTATLKAYYRHHYRAFSADVYRTHKADPDSDDSLQSLRYHRDNGPSSMVKVFVYMTDVQKETGAIEVTSKSLTSRFGRMGKYLREELGQFNDEMVRNTKSIEGASGCIILFTPQHLIHRAVLPLRGHRDVVNFLVHPTLTESFEYDTREAFRLSRNQGYLVNPFTMAALREGDQ